MRNIFVPVLALLAGLTALLVCAQRPAFAQPVVIDFDSLASMPNSAGSVVPLEARLSTQLIATNGVKFDSAAGYVAVVNLGAGNTASGANGIGATAPGSVLTYDGSSPINISFWDAADPTRRATTDFVSIEADPNGDPSQSLTMNAFDLNGQLVGSVSQTDVGGSVLSVSAPGIFLAQIVGDGSSAWDNLSFDPPTPDPSSTRFLTIDFEDVAGMSNSAGSPVPTESQLSTNYVSTLGVSFSSNGGYAAVVNLGLGAISGVNGIGGTTASGLLSYDAADTITVTFSVPSDPAAPAETDFVSIRGDPDPTNGGGPIELDAFDVNGNLLATATSPDTGGNILSVSAPGIHQVRITGNGSVAFDDLTFHPQVASVPVPREVELVPDPVRGGKMVTGQVALTIPAGAGGLTVNIASSNSAVASVPARVKVPAGAVNAVFSVKTSKVRVTTNVIISATANSHSASRVLTVNP